MAHLIVKTFMRAEWDEIVAELKDFNLLQSWEYGAAKSETESWQVERGVIVEEGELIGAYQALIRRVPVVGGGLAWVNRGPLVRRPNGSQFQQVMLKALGALVKHYVGSAGLYLRIAPPVRIDEFDLSLLGETGLGVTETAGWASADLDLTQDVAELRSGLHGKWRNALKRAEGIGVSIRESSDENMFEVFLAGQRRMIAEKGSGAGLSVELLSSLRQSMPPDRKPMVFLADGGTAPLGAILITCHGTTGEYLAGNFTDVGRRSNIGQALLWRSVNWLKENGIQLFDVGGMDPERTPDGIYRFKARMGGTPYSLVPELEAGGGGLRGRCVRWRVKRARGQA